MHIEAFREARLKAIKVILDARLGDIYTLGPDLVPPATTDFRLTFLEGG